LLCVCHVATFLFCFFLFIFLLFSYFAYSVHQFWMFVCHVFVKIIFVVSFYFIILNIILLIFIFCPSFCWFGYLLFIELLISSGCLFVMCLSRKCCAVNVLSQTKHWNLLLLSTFTFSSNVINLSLSVLNKHLGPLKKKNTRRKKNKKSNTKNERKEKKRK
jgi:hypothetical protein